MLQPKVGDKYIHKGKGGRYFVSQILPVPIKVDGVWREGGIVVYQSLSDGKVWSRLMNDFVEKFDKLDD